MDSFPMHFMIDSFRSVSQSDKSHCCSIISCDKLDDLIGRLKVIGCCEGGAPQIALHLDFFGLMLQQMVSGGF